METIHRDYSPKGVKFYYVYKTLAHPEINGYVSPVTLQERLLHMREARRRLGTQFTWLGDTMSNDVKHALGNRPNSEFVFDPDGRVIAKRAWSNPRTLRKELAELVGPVENPTQTADLDLPEPPIERPSGGEVVPRIELPGRMRPLKVEPVVQDDGKPFYVKLRAEADGDLLSDGNGKLYLGFFLDPLYKMHWNNLVDPLQFEVKAPEGVRVSPASAQAPQVNAPEDRDPREFLVDVTIAGRRESHSDGRVPAVAPKPQTQEGQPRQRRPREKTPTRKTEGPIELTVRYFACDDAGTFCIPVTQQYRVFLQRDPDGGSRRKPSMADRFVAGDFVSRVLKRDQNGDGKLSPEEAPEQMRYIFGLIDSNGNELLEKQELQARVREFRRWFGGASRGRSRGSPGRRPAVFQALDADGDGRLSKAELSKTAEAFDRLDENGDGSLTLDELLRPVSRD